MGKTKIEWVRGDDGSPGYTWNPVTGYAETMSLRPERLDEPLRVRKPSMFFTCSMGDLFHELVPWEFIVRVFDVMAATPQHTYQVLTKRPGRMAYLAKRWPQIAQEVGLSWAWPPNVWAGTSVESSKYLPRLDVLARVPAKVRFVSAEPLLGPLDLTPWLEDDQRAFDRFSALFWTRRVMADPHPGLLQWVIAGGESGPGYRKPEIAWFTDLRDQCVAAGVPFFLKQMGGLRPGGPALLDGREWREMPEAKPVETAPATG